MEENIMIIPNNNNLLEKELKNNKKAYIDQVFDSLVGNIKKDAVPDCIKIFTFENTDLQVIIKRDHYVSNIDNILEYYISEEVYEKCKKLTDIKSILILKEK